MLRPWRIRGRRGEQGGALVETALSITLYLMVLCTIVQFSRVIWAYTWTAHMAREASRWASVRGSKSGIADPDIEAFVKGNMMGLNAADATVPAQWVPDNTPGSVVAVTVQYRVRPLVPWIPAMTVQSSSRMVISQ